MSVHHVLVWCPEVTETDVISPKLELQKVVSNMWESNPGPLEQWLSSCGLSPLWGLERPFHRNCLSPPENIDIYDSKQ